MADADIDRLRAAAEAQLDRVDDGAVDDEPLVDDAAFLDETVDGMHIEEAGEPFVDDAEDDVTIHPVAETAETIDAICEAFNARDIDSVTELCSGDCETPGLAGDFTEMSESLSDLWTRRPTVVMTRAMDDDQALGVLWEQGEFVGWIAIGTMHVDLDEDGSVGVLEFSDDPSLLDELDAEPPDGDLEQGTRWEEWEEGAG